MEIICAIILLASSSCYTQKMEDRLARIEHELKVRLDEMERVLGSLGCTPELRSFLQSLKDCEQVDCKDFNIRASTISPNYAEGSFLHDIRLTEHQVVFLEDPYQIQDERLSQLVRFVNAPALSASYYVLINPTLSNYSSVDERKVAKQQQGNRSRAVRDVLKKYDNRKDIKEINYPIQADYARKILEKIRRETQRDAPIKGEPLDLLKSMWILRVSC